MQHQVRESCKIAYEEQRREGAFSLTKIAEATRSLAQPAPAPRAHAMLVQQEQGQLQAQQTAFRTHDEATHSRICFPASKLASSIGLHKTKTAHCTKAIH